MVAPSRKPTPTETTPHNVLACAVLILASPTRTIARSFSAALDDVFFGKPELEDLSQVVAQKCAPPRHDASPSQAGRPNESDPKHLPRQQSLSTQKSELEELEARLRETEARLKDQQQSTTSSSTPPVPASIPNRHNNNPRLRSSLEGAFDSPDNTSLGGGSETAQYGGDGSQDGTRRNGRSPLSTVTLEQWHPPSLRTKSSSSSNGNLDPGNQNSSGSPARPRTENTPPQPYRTGDSRPKSALPRGQGTAGEGNGNRADAASLREKNRNMA